MARQNKRPAEAGLETILIARRSTLAGFIALVDLVDDVDAAAPANQLVGAMAAHQGLQGIADFHRGNLKTKQKEAPRALRLAG
jgi:hypothetical protein